MMKLGAVLCIMLLARLVCCFSLSLLLEDFTQIAGDWILKHLICNCHNSVHCEYHLCDFQMRIIPYAGFKLCMFSVTCNEL